MDKRTAAQLEMTQQRNWLRGEQTQKCMVRPFLPIPQTQIKTWLREITQKSHLTEWKPELGDSKRLICSECIRKLREAIQFKEQVESSVRELVNNWKKQNVKPAVAEVKTENNEFDSTFDDFFDDDDNLGKQTVKLTPHVYCYC
ncbi:hypothetical protein evm_014485 [Chilo suppressalis]|nr:hypothetical protein evm_014485 [Chilo suppressalis]